MFTVFTATYNRAHTLPRAYASLLRQTCSEFEWIIVDDDSSDATRELVNGWCRSTTRFPIRYLWQRKQHKKAAFNYAVREARSELLLPLDSDDELTHDALAIFRDVWEGVPQSQRRGLAGVGGLCQDEKGHLVGTRYPRDLMLSDFTEMFMRYGVKGEKFWCVRVDILKDFPYPEGSDGFVPEGVVWGAIARKYKAIFTNQVVRIYHTGASDSVTNTSRQRSHYEAIAWGQALWARESLVNDMRWFKYRPLWYLKMAINYTRFKLHGRRQTVVRSIHINGVQACVIAILMFPFGACAYLTDLFRAWRRS